MARSPAVLALSIAAFLTGAGRSRPRPDEPWVAGALQEVRMSGRFEEARLRESSGVAVSRSQPGILWTHNDGRGEAELFAIDTTGRSLGSWIIPGATVTDWEDIGLGPCPAGTCLTIGDVGDNPERRERVRLYRVAEPVLADSGTTIAAPEALSIRYPDHPRDVEALFVDLVGDTWLISKGRSDGIVVYRVPASAWGRDSTTAELVGRLPIRADQSTWRLVTGGAISPDGSTVVVRTYSELHFFQWDGERRLVPAPVPNRCDIAALEEPQGEAVDWLDATTLVLTSEDRGRLKGPIHLLRCDGGLSPP